MDKVSNSIAGNGYHSPQTPTYQQRIDAIHKTKVEHTEEKLKENELYLEKAQTIGKIGHFNYDPDSGMVEGSNELFIIFNITFEIFNISFFL